MTGGAPAGVNPFRPGAGELPPVLAGREAELGILETALDRLARGERPPQGVLLFGPRGNGKTTLLARTGELARRRGLRSATIDVQVLATRESVARYLREQARLTGPRLSGAQAAGFGVSVRPSETTTNVPDLLAAWMGADEGPLVMLVDEAHLLRPEGGGAFFRALQEMALADRLFLLVVAGTPDAPRRIRECGTFTERMLERVPVGRLQRGETLRALQEPAGDAGRPFVEGAAAPLAETSQDYPFFIQLLGSAAWDAAARRGESRIASDAVTEGLAATEGKIARFYSERLDEARRREIDDVLVSLARFFRRRADRPLTSLALRPLMKDLAAGTDPPLRPPQLLEALADLGILWNGPAGWELGIPSFADYLLDLAASDQGVTIST